ncbi:hypothetical protein [Scytonema sp. PRP1]
MHWDAPVQLRIVDEDSPHLETLRVSPALLVGFPGAGDWRSPQRSD